MKPFNTQKGSFAGNALNDQRTQAGIDVPYMRSKRAGETSLKKHGFLETEKDVNEATLYVLGDVVKGGVPLLARAYGNLVYNAPMRLLSNIDVAVDPGPNNETGNYRIMEPIGRDYYIHHVQYHGVLYYRFDPAFASNVSLHLTDTYLRISSGKRKTIGFNLELSAGYYNYYDYQHFYIPSSIAGISDDYATTSFMQPLDAAAKPPTALISFPQNIGSVDIRGVAHHDLLFTTISKDTTVANSPVLRAIPRAVEQTDKVMMTSQIIVITPKRWVTLAAFSWENTSPYGYLGGKTSLFKTEDGGLSWTDGRSNDPSYAAFTNGFPLITDFVSPTNWYTLNRVLGFAIANQEWAVATPNIFMVSYPYWTLTPATITVPNAGYNNGSSFIGCGFAAKMVRTTDGGNSWAEVPYPTLLETVTSWGQSSYQIYLFTRVTYLGGGFMIAQIRASLWDQYAVPVDPQDETLVWNLAVSNDYGASWTCIPKVGIPDIAKSQPRYVGVFKVLKKVVRDPAGGFKAGLVVLTLWGGDGYYLYSSTDNGASWKKACLMAKSESFRQMGFCSAHGAAVQENGFNFNDIYYTGTPQSTVPVAVETPWRYDSSQTWVPE